MAEVGITPSTYAQDKANGSITIQAVGASKTRALLLKRHFDENTGDELDPISVPINPKALLTAKAALQKELAGIDAMLDDLNKLGVEIPVAP